jgi:hypothetical protein
LKKASISPRGLGGSGILSERANAADGPFSAACYVVKADGSTVASFVRVRDVDPGDVIMVPPNTEVKVRTRTLIRDIAQIFGSFAPGAAGIASVLK